MPDMYVETGYVECEYFVDDCLQDDDSLLIPECVKVFGFSRKSVIKPDIKNDSDDIRRRYNKKFGRKALAFPNQSIG